MAAMRDAVVLGDLEFLSTWGDFGVRIGILLPGTLILIVAAFIFILGSDTDLGSVLGQ